jgi:alkanesulfonate monooxygenase SsuD/methylene tetrahydromethanopterin reductase-like flavin-dependent oxidoreductase (luciferase family)
MQVSYFETARYQVPPTAPVEWPVPPGAYDPATGAQAYRGMVDRVQYVEALGFDWVSLSEHHYSPRILTPNTAVSASYIAARSKKIKIAVLGPIVSQSNPVQVAEELAMLDTLSQGRLIVGMLRGTTNEYLTFDLNPAEARERTTEGMELILKAWTEPQPFGWQGRHYQFRTVSVWPRPLQQPRILRIRGASSSRSRRLVRTLRNRRQVDALLSRGVQPLRLGADAGADAVPGEYPAGRNRRGSPGIA